jgi:hypothetical protein
MRPRRGGNIRWTKEEEEILRRMAQEGRSVGQIAIELNRTRSAIVSRTTKLKVPVKHRLNPLA